MPRDLIHSPQLDRARSLGWLALAWMEHFCVHGPGDVQGEPVEHGDERAGFVVDCYTLDERGRLLHDSAFLSRAKGCDKSGMGARFGLFEAFGPCRFAAFASGGEVYRDPWDLGFEYVYAEGEPMGRPIKVPYIRCMATEEGQTGNVYDAIYVNLTEGPLSAVPGVSPGLTRVLLPGGGEITPSTASSAAKDGGKETWSDFDETHLYVTPELRRMYNTVTRNLRKRKRGAGTWYLETTTMFAPGEESVAEDTYKLAGQIRDGDAKRERLLFDHRWGECEDLTDEDDLRSSIVEAYGEDLAYNDLDGIVDEFYDPRKASGDSRRFFLNAPNAAFDAWITNFEWAPRSDSEIVVGSAEAITLGFDGSRRRTHSVTDATALIACRVSDGHLFEPLERSIWEQPAGPEGQHWQVPAHEVEAAVDECFRRYAVVGFFADPAKWETYIARWEATFSARLRVRASQQHPIEWWTNRPSQMVQALDEFHSAVIDGGLSHDGSYTLTRHVLNARRRPSRVGLLIGKEHPDSANKIDAAIAAVLALKARRDALAKGIGRQVSAPRRIR